MNSKIYRCIVFVFIISACSLIQKNFPKPNIEITDATIYYAQEEDKSKLHIAHSMKIVNTSTIDLPIRDIEYTFISNTIDIQNFKKKHELVLFDDELIIPIDIFFSVENQKKIRTLLQKNQPFSYKISGKVNFVGFSKEFYFENILMMPTLDIEKFTVSQKSLSHFTGKSIVKVFNTSLVHFDRFSVHYAINKINNDGKSQEIYKNTIIQDDFFPSTHRIIELPFTLNTDLLVYSSRELVDSDFIDVDFSASVDFGLIHVPIEKTYAIQWLH